MRAKSFTKAIKGISLITAGVFSFSLPVSAQMPTITNDGAMFYVNTGGIVYCSGNVHNKLNGTIVNLGLFDIDTNIVNDGTLGGNGSPLPGSNGLYQVGGDWRNNNVFNAGTGKVLLDGTDQTVSGQGITGVMPSYFYDLELTGTNRKEIQFTDQFVTGTLILNDRELWTDEFTMHVENSNAAAITRSTGFVSSLESGSLSRRTLSTDDYLFPVGSTQGFPRYRPAIITPDASFPNRFTVRLVNADPSTDDPNDLNDYTKPVSDHDTTVCYVNDNYWYKINHPDSTSSADLALSYDAAVTQDKGAYNGIVQWRWDNLIDSLWVGLGTPTTNFPTNDPNDPATLTFVRKESIVSFSPEPFTLAYLIPPPPVITGLDELCADVVTTYSVIPPYPNTTYTFYVDTVNGVPQGEIIDTTDNSVTIIWNDLGAGTVHVVGHDNNSGYTPPPCNSLVGNFDVNILSLPDAIFGTTNEYPNPNPNGGYNYNNPDDVFVNDLISFHDSSTNTVSWFWDFDDNVTSVNQNPYHTYGDLGTYNVMMVATSPDGCLDTAYKAFNVVEGIIVSNVFTPNGDGYNDVFKIRNSGVGEFTFRVFNRWGTQIYETTAPEIAWDGKTQAGSIAPAGTYFYTLKAKLASGNAITVFQDAETLDKGTITLIR